MSKFSGSINDDHSIYSGSSSIVEMKPVRSLLDCVDQCMAERLCHGSFYIAPQRSDLAGMYYGKKTVIEIQILLFR